MLAIVVMILSIFAILLNTLRVRALPLERRREGQAPGLSEAEFLVPGMVRDGCANSIGTVLKHVHGVREVRPAVRQKRVHVRYETEVVKEEELRAALEQVGFSAVEA